jgi:exopolysaccharide production protein ExoY
MRISTEREFEIAPGMAESFEPVVDQQRVPATSPQKPFFASNEVSEVEAALIRGSAKIQPHTFPRKTDRTMQSATRMADVVVAGALFILLLPVLASIALFMCVLDRGPILFAHRRVGLGGKPFNCWKFRTMCVDADRQLARMLENDEALRREWNSTQKLLRDPRVTRFGRFLRNSSLDELPQLINVLRGEMGLVGPRPIIEDELGRYGRYAALYMSVRPGLTGLWQVTRNSRTSYCRRVATDVHYVRNRSLAFDFRILFATFPAVLFGNG